MARRFTEVFQAFTLFSSLLFSTLSVHLLVYALPLGKNRISYYFEDKTDLSSYLVAKTFLPIFPYSFKGKDVLVYACVWWGKGYAVLRFCLCSHLYLLHLWSCGTWKPRIPWLRDVHSGLPQSPFPGLPEYPLIDQPVSVNTWVACDCGSEATSTGHYSTQAACIFF